MWLLGVILDNICGFLRYVFHVHSANRFIATVQFL